MNSSSAIPHKRRRIAFAFTAPDAAEVMLVGSFNHWLLKKHPMKKDADGRWQKTVMLFPGEYEYKFWVDGQWQEDPLNPLRRPNEFGSANSIVHVELR